MIVSAPRPPRSLAMGTPLSTTLPVNGAELVQKNPAGSDCLEKSANVVPSPRVIHKSTPLAIVRSAARAGAASSNAKIKTINTESFLMTSPLLSQHQVVLEEDLCLGAPGGARLRAGRTLRAGSQNFEVCRIIAIASVSIHSCSGGAAARAGSRLVCSPPVQRSVLFPMAALLLGGFVYRTVEAQDLPALGA